MMESTQPSKKVYLDESFGPRWGQKRPLPQESGEKKPLTRNGRKKLKKRLKKKTTALQKTDHVEENDCNALILPAKKRKVETVVEAAEPVVPKKKLSKKERKRLEKKVQLAEKRAKRAQILAELQKYQATNKEMSVLASIKEVHTQRVLKKLPTTDVKLVTKSFTGVKKWKFGKKKKKKNQSVPAGTEDIPKSGRQSQLSASDLSSDEETVAEEKMEEESESETNGDDGVSEEEGCETKEEAVPEARRKKASKHSGLDTMKSQAADKSAEKPAAGKKKKKKKKHLSCDEEAVAEEKMEEERKVETHGGEVGVPEEDYTVTKEETVQKAGRNKAFKQKVKSKVGDESLEKPAAPTKSQAPTMMPCAGSKPAGDSSSSSTEKTANGAAKATDTGAADGKSKPSQHTFIAVERKAKLQASRLKLPILAMEQEVMETINENPVVIIAGETGSGKTTQVPQFLYEAGYARGKGIIAVTEPRRVAAVNMSQRVAQELNISTRVVSYQIRGEGNVTEDTKIKFMTDGVLLRELQNDFLLTKYSCVILDEAHERNVCTDILIGLLSRIIILRKKKGNPLKLVIMSATMRVEDFSENTHLFKVKPPLVQVEGRQFLVDLHWLKQTPSDYLKSAYRKVCQLHNDMQDGGILVFVTGRQEVHTLCHWLRKTFTAVPEDGAKKPEKRRRRKKAKKESDEAAEIHDVDLDSYSIEPLREEAEEEEEERVEREKEEQIERELEEALKDKNVSVSELLAGDMGDDGDEEFTPLTEVYRGNPLWVLPLYSLLPSDQQAKVFQQPPEGYRLCVVATNIAETSLTIPNIRFVVDTGKTKTRLYDRVTGVSTFRVTWASKASADQRMGRAGRLGPGKCFRLYSSAVFNDKFEKFSPPEILQRPIEDVVLMMKSWNITNVQTFPLPTAPKAEQIEAAERALTFLGALDTSVTQGGGSKLTDIGRSMAKFPVTPRYAKMLAISNQKGVLPYMIALVSALSVDQLFCEDFPAPTTEEEKAAQKERMQVLKRQKRELAGLDHQRLLGDMMVLLSAVLAVEKDPCPQTFEKYSLRHKAIQEVRKLRRQLTNIVNVMFPEAGVCIDPDLQPPTQEQARMMRQMVLSGLGDHVARSWFNPPVGKNEPKWKHRHAYQCMDLAQPVYIHQSSVLNHQKIHYIVYQDMIENESGSMFMKGVAAVEVEWLPVYAAQHCIMSSPLDEPAPDYDARRDRITCHMKGTYGRGGWTLPVMQLPYPEHRDKLRWFACFLLEGKIEPALAKYSKCLLNTPHTMVRPWAHLQPRTTRLLHAITQRVLFTKERLHQVWEKEPEYLLSEYLGWLPQALHGEVMALWPPGKV